MVTRKRIIDCISFIGIFFVCSCDNSIAPAPTTDWKDPEYVQGALSCCRAHRNPSVRTRAIELLKSKNEVMWFNAAVYLGAIEEPAAIPYLIRGLQHQEIMPRVEIASYLKTLTKKDFGIDQSRWIRWWNEKNPDSAFDFAWQLTGTEYPMFELGETCMINTAVDPIRIQYSDSVYRLIGVKPKDDVKQEDALKLLKSLVALQWVQLQFESGTKYDKDKEQRAFVYWIENSSLAQHFLAHGENGIRTGLPPVTFSERTLINTYLLKAGLYELDLDSVNDQGMKDILNEAFSELKQ